MHGEDVNLQVDQKYTLETPPHAWGRLTLTYLGH